ncbi:hypothetical protein [Vacuolonema iberomarrocanum]|uniref:hypothetical protein n=1 Tax=Vacuolonema iberomarrocanum TaxID=3454632 RepID=UPI003F6E4384
MTVVVDTLPILHLIRPTYLPVKLTYRGQSVESMALLDTGASVNVLPYEIGLQLGAVWEEQTVPIQLSGNLAQMEARGLVLSATIAEFSSVLANEILVAGNLFSTLVDLVVW